MAPGRKNDDVCICLTCNWAEEVVYLNYWHGKSKDLLGGDPAVPRHCGNTVSGNCGSKEPK